MSDYDDLFCALYIDCSLERQDLLEFLAEQAKGDVTLRTISSPLLEMVVSSNDEFDPVKSRQPQGFVYFPYRVEIEPEDDVDDSRYISSIVQLVESLRERGFVVVAACDFEDQLVDEADAAA